PLDRLVAEILRLLCPGGIFLFPTDYDASGQSHEIDPQFRVFGQSWQIFTPEALSALIGQFEAAGFTLLDPPPNDIPHSHHPTHPDRAPRDRPIRRKGQEYTFVMVGLRAPAAKLQSAPRAAGVVELRH